MLVDIALKNIWQRRLRSALTILGVAVAVQLYLTMTSIMTSYEQDLQGQLSVFAGKVFVQRPVAGDGGGEDFPSPSSSIETKVAAAVLALEGVDRASSSAVLFVPLARPPAPNMPPALMAVGIEPGHELAFLGSFEVEAGAATLTGAHGVILGQGAAQRYGPEDSDALVAPGETIEILDQSFTVVGVLESTPLLFNGAVLMPLAAAQDLFTRPDTISAVILTATSVEEAAALEATIETRFPELQASGQGEIAESANEMLVTQRAFFSMVNNTVIAVAVVVITIVMIVAVMERRREIGTLRAIGARQRAIFSLIISESLTLSSAGAIVALPLWVIVRMTFMGDSLDELMISFIGSGWMQSLVVAIVVGVLASLWPTWQAVRVDPLEAIRYE